MAIKEIILEDPIILTKLWQKAIYFLGWFFIGVLAYGLIWLLLDKILG